MKKIITICLVFLSISTNSQAGISIATGNKPFIIASAVASTVVSGITIHHLNSDCWFERLMALLFEAPIAILSVIILDENQANSIEYLPLTKSLQAEILNKGISVQEIDEYHQELEILNELLLELDYFYELDRQSNLKNVWNNFSGDLSPGAKKLAEWQMNRLFKNLQKIE
jgi:hypothetical protein